MKLIDSSALVKFFCREPGWEEVKALIEGGATIELAIKELYNAAWKKVRKGELDMGKELEERLQEFYDAFSIIGQKKYLGNALEIATGRALPVYDSIFIAVAKGEKAALVTADREQAIAAKEAGVEVIEC